MTGLRIVRLEGDALKAALPDLARLRIAVFRAWPYLYDGTQAYEEGYLRTYAETPGSVVIGALDGDAVVGAATALPLVGEPDYVTSPLRAIGWPVEATFYFGESVLLDRFRGQGVGVRFFHEREAAARAGGFARAVFCAVRRDPADPRRPPSDVPLDAFWTKRGFRKLDDIECRFSWRDVGEDAETEKPMRYWAKDLAS